MNADNQFLIDGQFTYEEIEEAWLRADAAIEVRKVLAGEPCPPITLEEFKKAKHAPTKLRKPPRPEVDKGRVIK